MRDAGTNTKAAGFVAKAMIHTAPSRRRALLVEMLGHVVAGLAAILGKQGCSELLYGMADCVATEDALAFAERVRGMGEAA